MINKKNLSIIISLLLLGFFLRYFNTISDGYWFDETLSFFISDPNISFQDFKFRHKTIILGRIASTYGHIALFNLLEPIAIPQCIPLKKVIINDA